MVSAALSNVWESFSTKAIFVTDMVQFPISNNIMLNLPLYIAVIGVIALIVMFAKPYVGGDVR
jgi:lipoprotein signal peptidase